MYRDLSTCQLLCALDDVDQNVVDNGGKTALDDAVGRSAVDCVRVLLELNVDTSKAVIDGDINVEIAQLLDEHRKRSVKKHFFFVGIIVFDSVVFRKLNE